MRKAVSVYASILAVGVLVTATAGARQHPIQSAMHGMRWGMDAGDVIGKIIQRIDKRAEKANGGPLAWKRDGKSRKQIIEEKRAVRRSYTRFDGDPAPWDDSFVSAFYGHHNDEAVIVHEKKSYDNYYFLAHDKLYQWVRVYPNGTPFGKLKKALQKRFGRARRGSGVLGDAKATARWLEWRAGPVRVRAVDAGSAGVALVFEQPRLAKKVLASRKRAKRQAQQKVASENSGNKSDSRFGSRKSVMSQTDHAQPSAAERRAKQKREAAERRRAQRQMQKRKRLKKQGKALKSLDGLSDDDPLAGIKTEE